MAGEICKFTTRNSLAIEHIRLLEIVQKQDEHNHCPLLHPDDYTDTAILDITTAWLIVNPELTAFRLEMARTRLLHNFAFNFRKLTNLVIGALRAITILNETEHCDYEKTWSNFPTLKSDFNAAFWRFLAEFLTSEEEVLAARRANHGVDRPQEIKKPLSDACKECFEKLTSEGLGENLNEILMKIDPEFNCREYDVRKEILLNLSYSIFNKCLPVELLRIAREHYPPAMPGTGGQARRQ